MSDEEFTAEVDAIVAQQEAAGEYKVRNLQTLLNRWQQKLDETAINLTPAPKPNGRAIADWDKEETGIYKPTANQ